jgi:hypothetical protein
MESAELGYVSTDNVSLSLLSDGLFSANSSNSNSNVHLDLTVIIPLGILLMLLSMVTFVGNVMVLHALRTEKKLHTVSNGHQKQTSLSTTGEGHRRGSNHQILSELLRENTCLSMHVQSQKINLKRKNPSEMLRSAKGLLPDLHALRKVILSFNVEDIKCQKLREKKI